MSVRSLSIAGGSSILFDFPRSGLSSRDELARGISPLKDSKVLVSEPGAGGEGTLA
jgi:hypothetical protein